MDESVPYKGSTGGRRAHTHASACESRTAATIVREADDLTNTRPPESPRNRPTQTPPPKIQVSNSADCLGVFLSEICRTDSQTINSEALDR